MRLSVKTDWSTYDGCNIMIYRYDVNESPCISIISEIDGPIATITRCIPKEQLKENESCLDTNNCKWAEEFIKKYKLGELTGQVVQSGFCVYPVVKWNMDELRKYRISTNP